MLGGFYAASGPGWRLAGSLVTLADEISQRWPQATCLGTIGDAAHLLQATDSDHNPFVTGPDGLGIVRAIDIGGPADIQQALFDHLAQMYAQHDARLYSFGYIHKDGVITNWSPAGGTHLDPGDDGHVHISVTQTNGNNPVPGPSGYVAAIDSLAPWGIFSPASPEGGGSILEDGMADITQGQWSTLEDTYMTQTGLIRIGRLAPDFAAAVWNQQMVRGVVTTPVTMAAWVGDARNFAALANQNALAAKASADQAVALLQQVLAAIAALPAPSGGGVDTAAVVAAVKTGIDGLTVTSTIKGA